MGRVQRAAYRPRPDAVAIYDRLYDEYRTLHDYFGRGANDVMKRLARHSPGGDGMTAPAELDAAIQQVREQIAQLHAELPKHGLVVWTGGNISARVPGSDLFVIKPSGVDYDDLTPATMVLCTSTASSVAGSIGSERSPSSDTAAHAYVYRHMPDVGGVVHTHSPYATAWAACHQPIPCVITGMADEFGGEIPVAPFSIIGDESIGKGIVETLPGIVPGPCCWPTTACSLSVPRPGKPSRPQ